MFNDLLADLNMYPVLALLTPVLSNASDIVNRFYPCMMSGLAYYLSQKYSPDRSQELERRYESELLRALDADNQGTSTFISPQTFYGDGV